MLAESHLAIFFDLLEPGQAVVVRGEARDDVVQAVAVHVIHYHLCAAGAEGERMSNPNGIAGQGRRLFPPAAFLQDVDAAIAIRVARAQAVSEPLPVSFGRDRVEGPGRGGMSPVALSITDVAARTAQYLRLTVAGQVDETGRLVIEHIKNNVTLPVSFTAFGVFVPGGFFAGKAIDENVGPAIVVEVISERKKTLRIGVV